MSDVVKVAIKRHEQLKAELDQIERFLKIAAELAEMELPVPGAARPAAAAVPSAPAPQSRAEAPAAEAPAAEAPASGGGEAGRPPFRSAGGGGATEEAREEAGEETREEAQPDIIDLRKAING